MSNNSAAPEDVQLNQPSPSKDEWMSHPGDGHECPKGLEYLMQVDQLIVTQMIEMVEAFTNFETQNRYQIKNTMGQKVYNVVEDTGCCNRNCCGTHRSFDIKISDNFGNEVIHLSRGLRCSTCWCPCCLQRVEVSAPEGNVIGYIDQGWSLLRPYYKVKNANDETVLQILGPVFTCNVCGDVEFQIYTPDKSVQVGEIRKQWSGLMKEAFTDADNFGITFPLDLDVSVKATLLGAIFLIDFMFFERRGNKPKNPDSHVGMLS